ncbi:glycosyl hydrolase family 28 protein [Microbacter margulisiae]|uniref:Polygalacturonase n=1 Tax=Microbacter margulisiae TaxID=1350067 RepID=A0A7W5H222_9PORP|nr:glycoside hydrolase family 28 protein [Microbacter margulisiae]MBB3186962.1 polygalacturonase [Microbacter margulisiae]
MKYFFVFSTFLLSIHIFAIPESPLHLIIAPGTLAATSVTIVWDKPQHYSNISCYHLSLNNKCIGTSMKCNYRIEGLRPATLYTVSIKTEDQTGKLSRATPSIEFTTQIQGKIINVNNFGAKGDGVTDNTKAIQQAINACPKFGTVLIPKGTFLSGALFLKSNMTLEITKGGVLKGSSNIDDYLPMINNRFEGWELKSYASLINAGIINHKGGFSIKNLSIKGEGTISGGGGKLGNSMQEKSGARSRARLILLMNCKNIEIHGLHIENSPCWTIQYVYSKCVSIHDLDIVSTARNGDGIDPDSSDSSYIFNCTFSTGDDCIAIKSGKNPDGYYIGKPTRYVRITDCNFLRGHGIAIGSEMSGGVSDVLIRDCKAGPLLYGMQIKATKDRGGYVKNVTVMDCKLQKITISSSLPYNNDGEPAPQVPTFDNFVFKNIDLSTAQTKGAVIDIHGFKDKNHKLNHVKFSNIVLPKDAEVSVSNAKNVQFFNVRTTTGNKPTFKILNSTNINY